MNSRPSAMCLSAVLLATPALIAQTPVPPAPVLGSSNPASAEPPVKRPSTQPCIVPLFTGQQFIDYTDKQSTYTPPANCKGPYAKVVFTADFNVSAGRQFDRTGRFFLGGANIYFGTTAEPRTALSPSWHVERDITDLSALLSTTQPVVASLGNFYGVSGGVNYNGIITGSAQLLLYPAGPNDPAPVVPDVVLPLSATGGSTALQTTDDRLNGTFPGLPRNIEKASLEVVSQSQASDEFWYTCSPDSVATPLQNCGGTGFRETEVYVDSQPAGIAPVFPWIYTGGIDPALWEPIPGVQTLNFKPYIVDLTPFAGALSDGAPHSVAMSVFNANHEFDVTGTLLLYLDHGLKQTSGAVTENTLSTAPTPSIDAEAPVDASGTTHGKTLVSSLRTLRLSGVVHTSHGKVTTTIHEQVNFGNYQLINVNSFIYTQDLAQLTTAQTDTKTQTATGVVETESNAVYPFTFNYAYNSNADGSYSLVTHAYQQDFEYAKQIVNGVNGYSSGSQEEVNTNDAYSVDAKGSLVTRTTGSTGSYKSTDTLGSCYSRTLTSSGRKLTKVEDGAICGGTNKP